MKLDDAIIKIKNKESVDTDEVVAWLRELRELRDELKYTKKFVIPTLSKINKQDHLKRCMYQLETLINLSKID